MKINILTVIQSLIISLCLLSANVHSLEPKHQKVVNPVVEAFKNNDQQTIVNLLKYPITRSYPIPAIKNRNEMLNRFSEVFDKRLITMIANSDLNNDWAEVGWRGIMFADGLLWLEETGKIYSINYHSESEEKLKLKIIANQKKSLHKSVNTFEEPILEWKTKRFHIRIDDMGDDNYRYAAWPITKTTSDKPDLILINGNVVFEGSGGNHHYEFKSGKYRYRCYVTVIGADDSPPGDLEVLKGDKVLLSEPVIEVLGL